MDLFPDSIFKSIDKSTWTIIHNSDTSKSYVFIKLGEFKDPFYYTIYLAKLPSNIPIIIICILWM